METSTCLYLAFHGWLVQVLVETTIKVAFAGRKTFAHDINLQLTCLHKIMDLNEQFDTFQYVNHINTFNKMMLLVKFLQHYKPQQIISTDFEQRNIQFNIFSGRFFFLFYLFFTLWCDLVNVLF